jgi:hypothetical protein
MRVLCTWHSCWGPVKVASMLTVEGYPHATKAEHVCCPQNIDASCCMQGHLVGTFPRSLSHLKQPFLPPSPCLTSVAAP